MPAWSRKPSRSLSKFTQTSITLLLQNALISMYDKCGSIVDARNVFHHLTQPDIFSWNMIIAAHRRHELPQQALTLFHQMQRTDVRPDQFTFSAILPVCAELASLKHGLQIHAKIIRYGLQFNLIVMNTVIDMYAKCGSMQKARELFDKMNAADVVSWNAMITGYAQNGFLEEALTLFRQMQRAAVQPNHFTFSTILPVCANVAYIKYGLQIHGKVVRHGFQSDAIVKSAVIDMHAKCGNMGEARELFDKMHNADVVSWNAMITGYAQNGVLDEALRLFKEMPQQNTVSWNAIIAGYVQNGVVEKALEIFKQMQWTDIKPDYSTFASILPACAKMGALEQGMEFHQKIIESEFLSDVVVTALIDMYAKCGSIKKARKLFDKMKPTDVASWNAIIGGYAMHGHNKDALRLFEQMKHSGTNPNHVSFVCILFACSHAGLVDDSCKYFNQMPDSYCIMPTIDHYVCMVDLLGRAGCLEEALNLIIKMPIKPDSVVLLSLLGACRSHKDVGLGEFVSTLLFELDPTVAAPHVLLSNIYARAGRWAEVQKVRKLMKDRGIKKIPGCSWIEVQKMVHVFFCRRQITPTNTQDLCKVGENVWGDGRQHGTFQMQDMY